jgi:hypothetical protein
MARGCAMEESGTEIQPAGNAEPPVSPSTSPVSGRGSALPTGKDNLETVSKLLTVFVVVLYACGFLITCITNSGYGFLDMNPLRPRPVLAGGWFVLFCALSFAMLVGCTQLRKEIASHPACWLLYARVAISYVIGCAALTTCTRFFFDFPPGAVSIFGWTFYGVAALLFALCVLAEEKHIPALVASLPASAGLLLFLIVVLYQTMYRHKFCDGSLFLWFSIGSLLTLFVLRNFASDRVDGYPLGVFVILAGLLIFARYFYPHAKPSWGGGGLLPVVIYTGKDAAVPGQKIVAMLIEDTDAGLYFVVRGDSRATFLPKSAVASIYFGQDGPASIAPSQK